MDTTECGLLIIGAGHAGAELAIAARQKGWQDSIVLLGDEQSLPYHRPPLSKAYLGGESDMNALLIRPSSTYEAANITLRPGRRLVSLDREAHVAMLADGARIRYGKLALCTGGRARTVDCEGLDALRPPSNLFYLRTFADADGMRPMLRAGARLVVIGGGYVGLEVAASAATLGVAVTVLEAQQRVLARVAGPELSAFYEDVHRSHGADIRTSMSVSRVECENGRIVALHGSDGTRFPADIVVVGIGMVPNVEVAQAAGLGREEGIPVDDLSRTVDPDIVAAGDCTWQQNALYDRSLRLESVPNALEQARAAASWLVGKPVPNRTVPWFWSDQYDLKLQMAGLSHGYDRCILRGEPSSHSFCVFYMEGDRLLAIDAVNRPGEFMLTRRALAAPVLVDANRLADESWPLKGLLSGAARASAGQT